MLAMTAQSFVTPRLEAAPYDSCPAEIAQYPWPVAEACSVSYCESRWQADADGGPNKGYFQVWVGWAPVFGIEVWQLYDAEINVRVAYGIWSRSGWTPWACQPY